MRGRDLVLALAAMAAASAAPAQGPTPTPAQGDAQPQPRAVARASKTDVAVGEVFGVEVVAEGPAGTEWSFPQEAGDERVELRTLPSASPTPGAHHYQAAAFAVGEAAVPPITVGYRLPDGQQGEVATEPIALRIASVLPKDPEEQKLADIRPPLAASIGPAFWIAAGVALALVATALFWLLRRRRRVAEPVQSPPVPPDVEAMQQLDRLSAAGLPARGELRAHYIELTQIAKRYLERRLGAPVLEMTSAEMVAFLRDHAEAQVVLGSARELSGAADFVKFAHGSAQAEEAERHLSGVRDWIRLLEQRLHVKEPPASTRQPAGMTR